MSEILLVSGWCGFRELFDMPEDVEFILPFIDKNEKDIFDRMRHGGNILICWSTGAHMALKIIDEIAGIYNKIVLVAPFDEFCSYTEKTIVKMMIRKMKKEPDEVVEDFLLNCGKKPEFDYGKYIDNDVLTEGLRYLIESKTEIKGGNFKNIIVIHGRNDKIVPVESGKKTAEALGSRFVMSETEHFVSYDKIMDLI